ncbi:MAG TPA: heme-binding protein [Pseudolabrys sp.]|nr:heme-binding protein [Pseudolabrys sp.]
MARLSVITLAACTAILLGSAVHAQQPATPAAPPPPPPAYGVPITLDQARAAIAAGQAEMKKNGWNQVIAIVGPGGSLVAFEKVDLAAYASVDIAQDKARMSASFRVPTKVYQERVAGGDTFLLALRGVVPAAGGIPIVTGGKVIGAVGVSGGTPMQDHQVAQAAIDAVK